MRASPDDILGMAFFARVVEARSFSDAARSLGVSKSAVSARVSKLEDKLGVRLLHRTTRRLALTADGVRLYERCARLVAEADEAAEIAAGATASPRGTLRVHAPASFAQDHLIAPIGDFMRAHPGVRVDLRLGDRIPDIAADGIDIGIVIAAGRLADSGLSARKIASARVAVCAAPEYLRRKGIPFRPQDLPLHDCLAHSIRQAAPTAEDWHFETDEGVVSISALAALVVDDSRTLREATLRGLGIAMLPELFVSDDLAADRLVRVLDDFQTIELGIHVLHPHGQLPPASVRLFVDHLVECFRRPPWERRAPTTATPPIKSKKHGHIPMTEQDVRRLHAVAALYAGVDAAGAARLLDALGDLQVMPASKIPATTVTMNSRVRCRSGSSPTSEREVSLVYPWDNATGKDRIDVLSEFGRALLGASVGTKALESKILGIVYQPEAAGDHHL